MSSESVLFNIAIDLVLRRTVEDQRRGIRWTPFSTLVDLDFADDLALLSHTWQHIQEKTDRLSIFSNQVSSGRKQVQFAILAVESIELSYLASHLLT